VANSESDTSSGEIPIAWRLSVAREGGASFDHLVGNRSSVLWVNCRCYATKDGFCVGARGKLVKVGL
jgi:hypothetical protein